MSTISLYNSALNSSNTILNHIKRLPSHIHHPEYEFTILFSSAVIAAFAPPQFPQPPFELKRFQGKKKKLKNLQKKKIFLSFPHLNPIRLLVFNHINQCKYVILIVLFLKLKSFFL